MSEVGINPAGQTTWDGKTMDEWIASGALPDGFYYDPEGAIRQEEPDMAGQSRPNMGSTHGIADYDDRGRITNFHGGGGAVPPGDTGPGGAHPAPPYDPTTGTAAALVESILNRLAAVEGEVAALAGLVK